jgi:hypothetical protein
MKKEEAVQSGRSAAGASAAAASVVSLLTNFEKWEVVVRRFAIAAMALGLGFSSAAFSQGRIIEETLVVRDPTVAAANNWVVGGAVEYWYVKGAFNEYNGANQKIATGDIQFDQPGGSLWVGYGDFTFMYTGRSGKGDETLTYSPGAINAQSLTTHSDVKQTDSEFLVRWLARGLSARWVTPYAVVGYTQTKFSIDETLPTGFFWTVNNSPTRHYQYTYKGPLAGIGAIFPFTETFGARVDGRLKFYSAEVTSEYGKTTGNGTGGDFILTGYMNFLRGFNLQAGYKFASLQGGDVGYQNRNGLFGMLGYSARF